MDKEIKFLYDDSLLDKDKLQEVITMVQKKPVKITPEIVFLRRFVLALFNAAKKKTQPIVMKKHQVMHHSIIHKKKEILRPIREISKPTKQIQKIKEISKPIEIKTAPIPEYPIYPVIRDSNNNVLVRAFLHENMYNIEEPILSEEETNLIKSLKEKFENKILSKPNLVNDKDFMNKIIKKLSGKFNLSLTKEVYTKIHYYLVRDILDYGKLNVLLKDDNVKEIRFKNINEPIKINYNNFTNIPTKIKFDNNEEAKKTIKKFFDKTGQKLTKGNNYIDTDKLGFVVKATYDFDGDKSEFTINK